MEATLAKTILVATELQDAVRVKGGQVGLNSRLQAPPLSWDGGPFFWIS